MSEKEKKINMKDHSFEEIIALDQSLQKLALYEVTEGMIFIPKSMEEQMQFERRVADKFNYFKRLIQKGECTYDFIKWHVLDKNGPFARESKLEIDSPKDISNWEEDYRKIKERNQSDKEESLQFIKMLMEKIGTGEVKVDIAPIMSENKSDTPPRIASEDIPKKRKKSNKKNDK